MKLSFEFCGRLYLCDLESPTSIAIPLKFDGPQPSYFGAAPATAAPVSGEGYVGSVAEGFCCNFDTIQMIPHCNGTHTETVGHIVQQVAEVPVGEILNRSLCPAVLVSVTPELDSGETYRPALSKLDRVITRRALETALEEMLGTPLDRLLGDAFGKSDGDDGSDGHGFALVVRTLPNDDSKTAAVYDADHTPPFFSATAMRWIAELGVTHLLVDTPSIDRGNDEGKLTNHHLFWNVPEETNQLTETAYRNRTVTEMIFVPHSVDDGIYGLDIQVPAMMIDAAPSRPLLFKTRLSS